MTAIEKRKEYNRLRRIEKKKNGICRDCSRPSVYNTLRCEIHLNSNLNSHGKTLQERSEFHKAKRKEFRELNKCTSCGKLLTEDDFALRDSKYTCLSCCYRKQINQIYKKSGWY